jgi:hypothetical protein
LTLLSIINDAQDEIGLTRASVVINSTDQTVRTLLRLADKEGKILMRRHAWQALVTEKTFTSTATEEQSGVIPSDLDRYVNESFYNRTRNRRVIGPLSPLEWQKEEAITASVLTDSFRVQGDSFLLKPVPAAGDTYAFEYVSKNWCQSSGGSGQSAWAADTDTSKIDEEIITLGVVWRFLKSKGLEYAEDYAIYQQQVTQAIMRDGARRTINFATNESLFQNARMPTVPEGSWSL